jgi:hypothetical protein
MARYQPYDLDQLTRIPVLFKDQILPGGFKYALNEIVDKHIDMRPFEIRNCSEETGRLAYDPAIRKATEVRGGGQKDRGAASRQG